MNIEQRIIEVKDEDLYWDWDSSQPTYVTKTPKSCYGGTTKFDPFPCYSHNRDLVTKTVIQVEKFFPIGFNTYYFLFPFEPICRTNGQAQTNTLDYDDNRNMSTWDGVIELYGKRIPPHPAMTRYLVSHEYGHIVDSWLCRCLDKGINGLDVEYAQMRGIDYNGGYGGRKWHTNIGEIIANDFRICVTGIEKEFWPHDCKHPDEDDNVKNWWYNAMLKYSH